MTAFCCIYLCATGMSDAKEEENDYKCGKSKSETGGCLAK